MKSFQQFILELKTIKFIGAKPHKVYSKNRVTNVGAGRAVPKRSASSASGGDAGGGDGGDGE
jgi:hypothetical protein